MVNISSDYDHFMADNVLKRGDLDREFKSNTKLEEYQKQEMIALIKILLGKANMPATEWNINTALDLIKTKSTDQVKNATDSERRKLQKDFRKFMALRRSLEDTSFLERMELETKRNHAQDALGVFQAAAKRTRDELAEIEKSYSPIENQDIVTLTDLIQKKGFSLEKPQGSSVHHFLDHLREVEKRRGKPTDPGALSAYSFIKEDFQSFVVEHDWASAFENVKDFDGGEIRLPFQFTCFEFRVSGIRILIFLGETPKGTVGMMASGVNKRWYVNPYSVSLQDGKLVHPEIKRDELDPHMWTFLDRLGAQIRAVCIMLDAKVAVGKRESVGGPGLNKQRQREGKAPLRDYHVVSLAKRMRSEPREDSVSTGVHRKLHWRRGHWRHFNTPGGETRYVNSDGILVSKTWISWQLVGDETLGFVNKHYKL